MRGMCNQTWLNPPMDGCKGDYITKLIEKRKKKKKNIAWKSGEGDDDVGTKAFHNLLNTYLLLC